ncbi:MAG TPA: Gldg family protein [Prolixibacteraceae bacterium]|nr:Gldg family protein [Prolixibacteraceae bacterium]
MKNKNTLLVYVLLIAGIIVVVNALSSKYFFRLDFTADKRYTLSKATRDIMRSVDDPVTVSAYFTKDLPPQIMQIKNEFREMLVEYANVSRGNLVFEFISPNENEEVEREIAQYGIAPQIVNVREKDQAVQKKVYLAATIKYGEKQEVIPLILPGTAMEYSLSTSIKKLIIENKPLIGFITGHGESTPQAMLQAMQSLEVLYDVEEVTLSDTLMPEKYKSLVMVAPKDSVPPAEQAVLDRYLATGGNLYLALNRVEGDFNNATGYEVTTGMESWLAQKGIQLENKFLVDATCGSVSVRQQQGFFTMTSQISFPYLPNIANFSEHPASKGLESVLLQFASPISFQGDTSFRFEPLAYSSEKSGTISVPLYFDIQKKWTQADFPLKNLPVAAAIEGPFSGNIPSRIVLVGDGDFAINGEGQETRQLNPDNVNLMVNAIDWLSDDTGLIELRTKGITNRPIDQIEDGKKAFLKYLNFLLPVLLIIAYGIFRYRRNKIKEIKRMQENYIK